ncbi:MAG TPA: hypothetical protein VFL47_02360 [Flavisolibacter sp.]|nr:hypothetical protein [Flavisolibacter sp.]
MEKFILKFPSFIYLTAFRKYAKANDWEVDIRNLVIQCNCSYKDALFACSEFNAVLLTPEDNYKIDALEWESGSKLLPAVPSSRLSVR